MSMLPPSVRNATQRHNTCLILEGFEEKVYFDKLLEFPIFPKDVYNINLINANPQAEFQLFIRLNIRETAMRWYWRCVTKTELQSSIMESLLVLTKYWDLVKLLR